jgi:hypothetical protein
MGVLSRFKNLRQNLARLSRRQKLLTGVLALLVLITWLAVCAAVVSIFL